MENEAIRQLREDFKHFEGRFDHHLAIYAKNGKELESVKTNQAWLMRFFWAFMTPLSAGVAYIALNLPT